MAVDPRANDHRVLSGVTLVTQVEYDNPRIAYWLPDLATDADGDVAFDVVWAGDGYYPSHAVGFLTQGGTFAPVADALGNSDPLQASSATKGNPVGDFETVRPEAPPYGNCLVAAGVVNRADKVGNQVLNDGYPVFTIFSRPGVKCPPGFFSLPVAPLPVNAPPTQLPPTQPPPTPPPPTQPPPAPTSLTLTCPAATDNPGRPIDLTGNLTPALGGRTITITISGAAPASGTAVTQSNGTYSFSYTPSQTGSYTIAASFGGESGYGPSDAGPCTVSVITP